MKFHLVIAAGVVAVLAMPLSAQAQGIIRGGEEGAAAGNRAAGPVGGAVGGVVGGVEGGIVGGVKGILGIPQRTGSAGRRDRWDRAELSANQINDQFAARAARIKADLRLTPEQAKNWPAVESAVKDIGKKNADLQIALRTERAQLKGPFDVIQQMREEARFLGERSADQKTLADAAEPLYVSLNRLKAGAMVTVSCAEGETGRVYAGALPIKSRKLALSELKQPSTAIMVNLGNPELAFKTAMLPNSGVGLARMEFIISEHIKIHPMALVDPKRVTSVGERKKIEQLTHNYAEPKDYFIERLSEGVGTIAAAFYPKPVIVRLSDFKTNEYARLVGGEGFEPKEENPMLGFRRTPRLHRQ